MKRPRNIVGPRVRALRQERGWSQATLAAKCQLIGWDVSRDVIAGIELRRRWIADAELFLLSQVLQVQIMKLFPNAMVTENAIQIVK